MAKFETRSPTLNKQLKKMSEKIDIMSNGFSEKQDAIQITTETPTSKNMIKQEMKIFTDNSNNAKLYFKDDKDNVYSLPLTRES